MSVEVASQLPSLSGGINSLGVQSDQDLVTAERTSEPSMKEEWIRPDLTESALQTEVMEESCENRASPAKDNCREKSRTHEKQAKTIAEKQSWDYSVTFISPEGTCLREENAEGDKTLISNKINQLKLSAYEKIFIQQLCFKKDRKIHTGQKKHQCSVCGKTFKFSIGLKMHQRVHTGEKPHQCSECGWRFSYIGNLRKHLRTHTVEKGCRRDEGGRCFSHNWNGQTHQKVHEPEKIHEVQKAIPSQIEPQVTSARLCGDDMEVGDSEMSVEVASQLPSLSGGIDSLGVQSDQNPVTAEHTSEPSTEEEWIHLDPAESTLQMEVVEESYEESHENRASPAKGPPNPQSDLASQQEKGADPDDKRRCEEKERATGDDTEVGDSEMSVEMAPQLPSLSGGIERLGVHSDQNPLTTEQTSEPSKEEEWIRPDPIEITLLMEVVEESYEESYENGASPAKGPPDPQPNLASQQEKGADPSDERQCEEKEIATDNCREKSKTHEKQAKTIAEKQSWDYSVTFISPEGTYLQEENAEGDKTLISSKISQLKLSEYKKSLIQQLCHTKGGKIHTGQKNQCLVCGKTFKFSIGLKMHQRIHAGEKLQKCSDCGRCFIPISEASDLSVVKKATLHSAAQSVPQPDPITSGHLVPSP